MKVELVALVTGELQLEVITETAVEYQILSRAWELNGYKRGNGRSATPSGARTGFYIPLCALVATSDNK